MARGRRTTTNTNASRQLRNCSTLHPLQKATSASLLSLAILLGACNIGAAQEATLNRAIYERAELVFEHADRVRYEHHHVPARDQVVFHGDDCTANTDCSGFVSYVLREVAPKHYKVIHRIQPNASYPQAKTYAHFFRDLSADQPRDGWIRVRSYQDLRRGDIIAWTKGQSSGGTRRHKHGNTGHVMVVAESPGAPQQEVVDGRTINYVDVHVIDASSVDHFKPETLPPLAHQDHRDGVGKGIVRLILNDDGRVDGYWEGTYWNEGQKELNHPAFSSIVEFGRALKLEGG